MVKLAGLLLVVFIAVGCAGSNTQTQLVLACQTYSDTLYALEPFKPVMNERQITTVRESVKYAGPICTGDVEVSDPRAALDAVRAKLRELLVVQMEVKPA